VQVVAADAALQDVVLATHCVECGAELNRWFVETG
jgi:hypothetical protein